MKKKGQKSPFKTPEGYFKNFEGRLKGTLFPEESMLPKKDGFTIPKGYFENFRVNVGQIQKTGTKVVPLSPYKRYYVAIASIAAVTLLLVGLPWNSSKEASFKDLANIDIDTYFDSNDLDLSSYEIAEVLPVDELEINDILEKRLNNTNILEYLDDTVEDYEELNPDYNEYP